MTGCVLVVVKIGQPHTNETGGWWLVVVGGGGG
jgi:hypothetical protein